VLNFDEKGSTVLVLVHIVLIHFFFLMFWGCCQEIEKFTRVGAKEGQGDVFYGRKNV